MISGSIRPAFSRSAARGASRSWENLRIMSTMIVSPYTGKLLGITGLLTRLLPPGPGLITGLGFGVRGVQPRQWNALVDFRHDPGFLTFLLRRLGRDGVDQC